MNQTRIKAPKESSSLVLLLLQVVLGDLMKIQKIDAASTCKKTKIKSFKGFLKVIKSFWKKRDIILPNSKEATLRHKIIFLEILSRVSLTSNQSLLSSSQPVRTLSATKTSSYQSMTRLLHLTKTMLNLEEAKKIRTQLQNNSKSNRFKTARDMWLSTLRTKKQYKKIVPDLRLKILQTRNLLKRLQINLLNKVQSRISQVSLAWHSQMLIPHWR